MTRRETIGMMALLAAPGMLAGCGLFNRKVSYHYRMTVEAESPRESATASSVYEVRVEKNNDIVKLAEERSGGSMTLGQAIVLNALDGPVFVLMQKAGSTDGLQWEVTRALKPEIEHQGFDAFVRAARALHSAVTRAELPRTDWPMMVRVQDISNPKSVEQVDPDAIGVRGIWVETTRDPVTNGIERRLVWLDKLEAASSSNVMQTFGSQLTAQLRVR